MSKKAILSIAGCWIFVPRIRRRQRSFGATKFIIIMRQHLTKNPFVRTQSRIRFFWLTPAAYAVLSKHEVTAYRYLVGSWDPRSWRGWYRLVLCRAEARICLPRSVAAWCRIGCWWGCRDGSLLRGCLFCLMGNVWLETRFDFRLLCRLARHTDIGYDTTLAFLVADTLGHQFPCGARDFGSRCRFVRGSPTLVDIEDTATIG